LSAVVFRFNTLCCGSDKKYIFQFAKDRKLTGVYHSHDFYELLCFLRGNGTQIINDRYIHCKEKTVVLLRPGDRHCMAEQSTYLTAISLSVKREEFELFMKLYEVASDELACQNMAPICFPLPYTSILFDKFQISSRVTEHDCKLMLSALLYEYISCKEDASQRSEIPTALYCAAEEMKKTENLKTGISAFVTLSNYSHSHLARLVKKHFGVGLKQYINELRLQRAYSDLVLLDESAEEISERLGFSSYSHFYRIFKDRFSVSPSELRKGK